MTTDLHPDPVAEAVTNLLWSRFRSGLGWSENWCTAYDNSVWHTREFPEVYINGIMACVDFDYEGGYLVMVCDRSTEATDSRFLAIAHSGFNGVRSEWYDHPPVPFFEVPKKISQFEVIEWFVEWYRKIDQEVNGHDSR